MIRAQWSIQAGQILSSTLEGYPLEQLASDIECGELELWHWPPASFAVLEQVDSSSPQWQGNDHLYVWAYAGGHLRQGALDILDLARKRGLPTVLFRTQHKGLPRLISNVRPAYLRPIAATHAEFEVRA